MQSLSDNFTSVGEKNITYPIPGQDDVQGYLTSPPQEGSTGLVMIQEWWGMNKSITNTADTWAAAGGSVVLTPDLYKGKVAKDREEAGHYMGGLDWAGAVANISAAVSYLKSKGCKKVGVTGFCMGGALALVSLANSDQIDATIAFYGVPDLSKIDLSKVKTPLRAVFGDLDQAKGFSDITARQNLDEALKKAGVSTYEIKVYEGGDHAFMNPDSVNYNADVAKQCFADSIAWFKTNLA